VRNASRDRVAGPECGEVKTWDGWDGKGSGKVGRGRWEVGRGVRVEGGMEGWRDGGMEGWRERGHRWVGLRHVPHVPSGDGDTDLDRLPSCGGSARPFHRCCVRMRMALGLGSKQAFRVISSHRRSYRHVGSRHALSINRGLSHEHAISHNLSHRHRHRHLPAAAVARAGRP